MEIERVCDCMERHDGGYLHRRNCYRVTKCGHVLGSRGDGCEVRTCGSAGRKRLDGVRAAGAVASQRLDSARRYIAGD